MGSVVAIANQKGGVGKTTTAVNLGASIADAGHRTLLVDLDPQCNATVALGMGKDLSPHVYDCLAGELKLPDAATATGIERLDLVPSTPELAGANVELPRIAGVGVDVCARGWGTCASATSSPCWTARLRLAR